MATLILSATTKAEPFAQLPPAIQHNLTHWFSGDNRAEAQVRMEEKRRYAPWTASLETLGLFDFERNEKVLYVLPEATLGDIPPDVRVLVRDERAILEAFWQGALLYDTFVTYNGRRFLWPFVMQRSAILGIRPTVNVLTHRYLEQQGAVRHVDLLDQMTFYGALAPRPSLELLAYAYNIPWEEHVAVLRDIVVIGEVYEYWQNYLAAIDEPIIDL